MPSTIYTVAEAAGVSPATVSRALNHPEKVRSTTRDRVYDAMRAVGFAPRADIDARRRLGVTTVGVIGPFSAHESARRRLAGVLRSARQLRFEVVVQDHPTISRYVQSLNDLPAAGRLDGLIVISLPTTKAFVRTIRSLDLPTILLDQTDGNLPSIQTDDAAGGRIAAEHLLTKASDRFMIMRSDDRDTSPSGLRSRSFAQTVIAAGRTVEVITTPADIALAATRVTNSLSSLEPTVGIFATDDERATAALRASAALGLHVPTEVRVVGYDDSLLARVLGITTVHQPLEESGDLSVRTIASMLKNQPVPHTSTLRLTLVQRSST